MVDVEGPAAEAISFSVPGSEGAVPFLPESDLWAVVICCDRYGRQHGEVGWFYWWPRLAASYVTVVHSLVDVPDAHVDSVATLHGTSIAIVAVPSESVFLVRTSVEGFFKSL